MSISNWLKSTFGKKSETEVTRTLMMSQKPCEEPRLEFVSMDNRTSTIKTESVVSYKFDFGITSKPFALGYLRDLRYAPYAIRDDYDINFGDIVSILFDTEIDNGKAIEVTRVYYFGIDEHVYYYKGFEPRRVRNHRQYIEKTPYIKP